MKWALLALVGCAVPTSTIDQADTSCAPGPTIRGIDVSSYDTGIDWPTAHAAGLEFAFVRVSDGTQYPDPAFADHWAGAQAAGLVRGAYQYFRPNEDPIAQADLLLQRIMPREPDQLPPVLDLETTAGLTQDQVVAAVHAWVDHVAAAIGRPPIIYAGLYSWPTLTNSADFTSSPLWIAQYTAAACPDIPRPWTSWLFWQDTATGQIAGVPGAMADLDLFAGTLDDLTAFAEGVPPPPCGTIDAAGGTIDDGDPCFVGGGPPATLRHISGAGENGTLIWTHATAAATEANFAQWNLYLAEAGSYRIEAYTDHAYATSHQADYLVHTAGGDTSVTIDQSAADGWQSLGDFDLAAGGAQWIHLGDDTGEPSSANAQLVFDAIRLTRLDAPTTPPKHHGAGCATGDGGALLLIVTALAWSRRRSSARRK
jgi:lysozyme